MDTERVGIRQFRDRLTFYMKKIRAGHSVVILDRGVPLARVSPVHAPEEAGLWRLCEEGIVDWGGGKPVGNPVADRLPVAADVGHGGAGPTPP